MKLTSNGASGLLSITAGNQHLNLPFLGDYSNARVLPYLYRAVDVKYGNDTDFIRVTRVFSYKSYADSTFTRTSRLAQDNTFSGKTDGLIALGLAKNAILVNATSLLSYGVRNTPILPILSGLKCIT